MSHTPIITSLQKDYLMSNLRSHVSTLHAMLFALENAEQFQPHYLAESLLQLERQIRQLRKVNQRG